MKSEFDVPFFQTSWRSLHFALFSWHGMALLDHHIPYHHHHLHDGDVVPYCCSHQHPIITPWRDLGIAWWPWWSIVALFTWQRMKINNPVEENPELSMKTGALLLEWRPEPSRTGRAHQKGLDKSLPSLLRLFIIRSTFGNTVLCIHNLFRSLPRRLFPWSRSQLWGNIFRRVRRPSDR